MWAGLAGLYPGGFGHKGEVWGHTHRPESGGRLACFLGGGLTSDILGLLGGEEPLFCPLAAVHVGHLERHRTTPFPQALAELFPQPFQGLECVGGQGVVLRELPVDPPCLGGSLVLPWDVCPAGGGFQFFVRRVGAGGAGVLRVHGGSILGLAWLCHLQGLGQVHSRGEGEDLIR